MGSSSKLYVVQICGGLLPLVELSEADAIAVLASSALDEARLVISEPAAVDPPDDPASPGTHSSARPMPA